METRKIFCKKLSSARNIAFDTMALLDRLEAEMNKDSATPADISAMARIIRLLTECNNRAAGYAESKFDM